MHTDKPQLYATLTNAAEKSVRHLLVFFVDGSRETQLIQICDGVESLVLTGTEFETRQKADALIQQWVTQENFIRPRDGFAFEPLERTISLAKRMGFKIVYDERFKSMTWPNPNLTGAAALSAWPGMTPSNGGGYLYALDQMRLHARPTLPPSQEPLIAPRDGKEFATFILKHKAVLDTVGPYREFILAGDD
jgi:hypothetical protein